MTNNWGTQIVNNLESGNVSKDRIIEVLMTAIDQMTNINCADHITRYFERTIEQTKPSFQKNWINFETKIKQ